MAADAGEPMLAAYGYQSMERLLDDCGFLIYEHLDPEQITEKYFRSYNQINPDHQITAVENVSL